MVGFEMGTARGVVAIRTTTSWILDIVVAMLSWSGHCRGTDYAIFLIGRYQEARQPARIKSKPDYTMFREPPTSSWIWSDHRQRRAASRATVVLQAQASPPHWAAGGCRSASPRARRRCP